MVSSLEVVGAGIFVDRHFLGRDCASQAGSDVDDMQALKIGSSHIREFLSYSGTRTRGQPGSDCGTRRG